MLRRMRLMLVGTLVSLLFFEVSLRAANAFFGWVGSIHNVDAHCLATDRVALRQGQDFTGLLQFDEVLVRRWSPNVVGLELGLTETGYNDDYIVIQTNDHGWRDVPRRYEKPQNVYRIVLIADSFGEPWRRPAEDGIAYQLESWLNEQDSPGRPVEVINLSLSGSNMVDYSLVVQHEAPKYQPDLIVVMIFTSNDVFDGQFIDLLTQVTEVDGRIVYRQEWIAAVKVRYQRRLSSPAEDGSLTWEELEQARQQGRLVVEHQSPDGVSSYALQLPEVQYRIPVGLEVHCFLQRVSRAYTFIKDRVRIMQDNQRDRVAVQRDLLIYQDPPDAELEAGWQHFEQLMRQMASDAEAQGTQIAYVIHANGEAVYPVVFNQLIQRAGADADRYTLEYPDQRIRRSCEADRLTCWFLLPAMSAASRTMSEQLYDYYEPAASPPILQTGHYTPTGYRLAAQTIGSFILDKIR